MSTRHIHTEGMLEGWYFGIRSPLHMGLSLALLALTLLHSRVLSPAVLKGPREEGALAACFSCVDRSPPCAPPGIIEI